MILSETKKCYTCKEEKLREEFYKHSARKGDGRSAQCKLCDSSRKRKLWKDDSKYKRAKQINHLVRTYGSKILDLEKPKFCPICLRNEEQVQDTYKRTFVIDHCHETKAVRGWLCNRCNMGLGYFRDNIADLERAIEYLNSTKEKI